jgi:hypothetical protein
LYAGDFHRNIELDENDKLVLSHVDGKRTVAELMSLLPLGGVEVRRAICALLAIRVIETLDEPAGPSGTALGEEGGQEERPLDPQVAERINRIYLNRETIGHYDVLGVEADAASRDIRAAYIRAAKTFHPDVHFHLPDVEKEKLNVIFSLVSSAYSILSDSEKRKEYDEFVRSKPSVRVSGKDSAKVKFDAAKQELKSGSLEKAARLFAEAAYLDDKPFYHLHHAKTLNLLGEEKKAERIMRKLLNAQPDNAEFLAEAGHTYMGLGLAVRARGCFEKALTLEPSNMRAKKGLRELEGKAQQGP